MAGKRIVAVSLALALSGCMNKADAAQVDAAVSQFFQMTDAKQYDALYPNLAPEFQAAMPQATFAGFMQRIDRKMGACKPVAKTLNYNINVTPNGTLITQGYSRDCANGKLALSLTTITRGGKTQILRYNADNPLLLTD